MSDFTISDSLKMSNDMQEFLFVSSTEGPEPTEATSTTTATAATMSETTTEQTTTAQTTTPVTTTTEQMTTYQTTTEATTTEQTTATTTTTTTMPETTTEQTATAQTTTPVTTTTEQTTTYQTTTEATTTTEQTTEASTTKTTTTTTAMPETTATTTTSFTTTTTPEATTTEAATTTTEQTTTTTLPPLVAAEVIIEFEETTTMAPPTTEVQISIEAAPTTEQTTTTEPPLVAEEESSAEETVDWSTFADELGDKIADSVGSDENLEPASSEGGDKVVEPEEDILIESKSYFSCSSPVVTDDGSISPPGKAILLEYDYDLTTKADLDDNTLSGLEDGITMHLAEIYGLTSCRRRHLRGLKADIAILALDSKPVDVNVADTSDCVTKVVDKTGSCTAIKGFMTAYVEPNSDSEAAKTKLLSLIEEGMASGAYTDDNIIEASYIGSRPVVVAGDLVDKTKVPVVSEIQVVPLREDGPPILAIGLSAFLLGFAALVLLCAFFVHRREKGIEEPSDESTQQPVTTAVEKIESAESTVELTEKGALDLDLPGDMYGDVASSTLSSSGEEGDLRIAITEDYSHLFHHFSNYHGINQIHFESRLPVIDSESSLEERSFETGTPITTPITSPVSSPNRLLPSIMSPEPSVDGDLLTDVVYYGTTLDSIPL